MNLRRVMILFLYVSLLIVSLSRPTAATQSDGSLYVTGVAWSSDGSKIAAVSIQPPTDNTNSKGYVSVYDADTQELIYQSMTDYGGYSSVAWSPDGRFIAIGSFDQTIKVIDIARQETIATLAGHRAGVASIDWSPDGETLISAGATDQQVILWNMSTYAPITVIEVGDPWEVAFSPDGQRIAIGGGPGLYVLPVSVTTNSTIRLRDYRLAKDYIGGLAWTEDGSQIAFGTLSFPSVLHPEEQVFAQVVIVDANTGTELQRLETKIDKIFSVAIVARERLIAVQGLNGSVEVWNLESNTLVTTLNGSDRYASSVNFSPYGGRLAYSLAIHLTERTRRTGFETSGVAVIVPDPSLERLEAIAALCSPNVETLVTASSFDIPNLPALIAQVAVDESIPPACVADLIAVAKAILAQAEA